MNRKTFSSAALALVMALLFCIPAFAAKATYTMTFTEGIKLINPLTGKKPTQIFTGTDVPSITVEEGGSFVFPENTIIFRDYIFSGWKYIYTDENGEKKAKIYQPGDTFENVGSDIEFGAYWTRPVPIDLVITGFLTFANNEPYSEGELPDAMQVVYNSTVKLKKLSLSKDGYTFRGWVDSDGMFYENGGEYTVSKLNPVLTAVWEKDGDATLTHKVVYAAGAEGCTGELPRVFEMYQKNTFTASECTLTRKGYRFVCWVDESGREYNAGSEYSVEGDTLTLTAKWEKVTQYYTVSIYATSGGSVSPSSAVSVAEGDSIELVVTPFDGYIISSVTMNGTQLPVENRSGCKVSASSVTSDSQIVVTFTEAGHPVLTLRKAEGGTLTEVTRTDGRKAFSVNPDSGYTLKSVTVSGAGYTVENGVYVLEEFSGEAIVTAEFAPVSEQSGVSTVQSEAPGAEKDGDIFYFILMGIVIIGLIGFAVIYTKRR